MGRLQKLAVFAFVGKAVIVAACFCFGGGISTFLSARQVSLLRPFFKEPRLLCFIPAAQRTLHTKALAVRDTWARRCDKTVFFTSELDPSFPTVKLDVREGPEGLTSKTMEALNYIFHHHLQDADWFLKADDDTYIIVENLKFLLSKYKPREPLYLGHHFRKFTEQGYMSGGAGYVLSREALKRVVTLGYHNTTLCRTWGGAEDAAVGRCLEKVGVRVANSLDAQNRQTFHPFNLASHLFGPLPQWYQNYSKHKVEVVSARGNCMLTVNWFRTLGTLDLLKVHHFT